MKTMFTSYGLIGLVLGFLAVGLVACEAWELPTHKTKRECTPPNGTLVAQPQQLKVNFSIANNTGTIDAVKWDFGNGSTTVTSGLTTTYTYPASNTYTVKATLTNTCGGELNLSNTVLVSNAVTPAVTLEPATDVGVSSATMRLTITSNGNATVTRYGICYSQTNPTPELGKDNVVEKTTDAVVNSPVAFTLTGLPTNTFFYARAFVVNSTGSTTYTAYSAPVQTFRTGQNPAVTVTANKTTGINSATVELVVQSPGNPPAAEYGICYSATNNAPDLTNATAVSVQVANPSLATPTSVNLTNLVPNTKYYYRSYAKLASGTVIYGTTVESFSTQVDQVTQGLIASISFTDKSLLDESGNANHVKLVGNPQFVADRKGKANMAIQLNGAGDYFYMPDNASLNPQALSISIWIKPRVFTGTTPMQIYNKSKFSDDTGQMYSSLIKPQLNTPGVTINTDIKQGSNCQQGKGWQTFPFSSNFPLDTWHHVVMAYSGRSVRMYFDGTLLYSRDDLPASVMDNCPGGELKFGAQSAQNPWYFNGAMDDIRIYNRAITAEEVKTLYNQ